MMRRICILLSLLCLPFLASAQRMTFIYISHDESVPTEQLVSTLRDVFDAADEDNQCIMYLASGENPKIISSTKSVKEEVDEFFDEFFNYDFHNVSPAYDLRRIIEITDNEKLLERGFDNTTFSYYISNSFISDGYFNDVVAKSAFCMELEKMGRVRVGVRIYAPEDELEEVKKSVSDAKGLLSEINVRYFNY